MWVKSPANRHVQVFVGNDQSPKTRSTIALGKKALLLAKELYPRGTWNLLKFEGIVTLSWKPVIRVEAMVDRRFKVQWNHSAVPRQIKPREFNEKFEALASARHPGEANIQWL